MARRAWLKALVLTVLLAVVFWVYETTDYQRYLTRERLAGSIAALQQYAANAGPAAPALFIGAAVAAIVAYVPALVVIFIAVCIFGALPGALMSAASIYLAITIIYFTAQWLGRDLVVRLAGRRLEKFESRLSGRGFWAVLYLRLFFFVLPPTNWLLGLSSIRFRHVFWGTVLGTVHHILIFSWLTELIVHTLEQGGSLNPIETPALLVPLAVGSVLFVGLRLVDRRRGAFPGKVDLAVPTNDQQP
jgi:uncharacterized membrane protein YdjX (TVP38/TMEM64 family)